MKKWSLLKHLVIYGDYIGMWTDSRRRLNKDGTLSKYGVEQLVVMGIFSFPCQFTTKVSSPVEFSSV